MQVQYISTLFAVVLILAAVQPLNASHPVVCPDIQFFTEEGQVLHASLTQPEQLQNNFNQVLYATQAPSQPGASVTCAEGEELKFTFTNGPAHYVGDANDVCCDTETAPGQFSIENNGSFTYRSVRPQGGAVWNGYDSFKYSATCNDQLQCTGHAYITTTFTTASIHNSVPNSPNPNVDFEDGFTEFVKCSGSCMSSSNNGGGMKWFARHTLPRIWDIMPDETGTIPQQSLPWVSATEQVPTDGLEFDWRNNHATVTTYGAIGSMGVRFPTMEEVTFTPGHLFQSNDYAGSTYLSVHADSTGFDMSCLDEQSTDSTIGDAGSNLWNSNLEQVGTLYDGVQWNDIASHGASWYYKFNGKHNNCNLFGENTVSLRCRYAPLLTPIPTITSSGSQYHERGVWRLTIKNCMLKWEGRFTWDALNKQKLSNGNRAWELEHNGCKYTLSGNVYNEAVQPNSWTDIKRGFAWIDTKYLLKIVLEQNVDFTFDLGIDIFTVDLQQFTYNDNGDYAFGYNMIVYPTTLNSGFAPDDGHQLYPDRRIQGLMWVSQFWSSPNYNGECPSCPSGGFAENNDGSNTANVCTTEINDNAVFSAAPMNDDAKCGGDSSVAPIVTLKKGPAATPVTTCGSPVPALLAITGIPGVSNQVTGGCNVNYQNITLRGVATGSSVVPSDSAFGFEGTIVLTFYLVNGEHPHFQLTPHMFVKSLCVKGGFSGTSYTCRTSPYWPVAHVDSTDLPDYICEEPDARTFGPTDWAVIFFDITDIKYDLVDVKSLSVTFTGLSPIVFIENALPTSSWQSEFGYLHFRDLIAILGHNGQAIDPQSRAGVSAGPKDTDYGFAFTPGAHNENTKITIQCTLTISAPSSSDRRFGAQQASSGENSLNQEIQITRRPLSSASVSLSNIAASSSSSSDMTTSNSNSNVVITVLAVACGLLVVAVIGMAVFVMKRPDALIRVNSKTSSITPQ